MKLAFLCFIVSACFIIFTLFYYSKELPDVNKLKHYQPDLVSKIYATNGQLLEEYAEEYRLFVPINNIPKIVVNAILAAEDADFYSHPGIDILSIFRATFQNIHNIKHGRNLIGGSTITQQVAKNLLLSNQRSLERKIKEAILSLRMNSILTKDEILELYLNHIYLGNRSYGVASAATKYFNKDLEDLTIAEAALLAALPKAPSYFNPKLHKGRAYERRNWVLKQMYEKQFITKQEYFEAKKQSIEISDAKKEIFKANYFSNEVRNIISRKYGKNSLFVDGLVINTTIIPELQTYAQKALKEGILYANKKIKYEQSLSKSNLNIEKPENPDLNGALVVVNNNSGRVVALAGGYDFDQSHFNRATQAVRQPGSAFKPFIYLTALENGFSPVSILDDMPISISQGAENPDWMPKNFMDDFLGKVTLRRGLELSLNATTVNLASKLGLHKISSSAMKAGVIDKPLKNHSAALGAVNTTLINLVAGYATIVNGGKKVEPIFIETIQDHDGKVIYRNENLSCKNCKNSDFLPKIIDNKPRVFSKEATFQTVKILQGAVERGTARRAKKLKMKIGGKTGTTNNNKDAWFVGFTPDYTIGIYVGYDAPKSMGEKSTGATTAIPIFLEFMNSTKWFFRDRPFKTPHNIRMAKVDLNTGIWADGQTKTTIFEAFKNNEQPNKAKSALSKQEIDSFFGSDRMY